MLSVPSTAYLSCCFHAPLPVTICFVDMPYHSVDMGTLRILLLRPHLICTPHCFMASVAFSTWHALSLLVDQCCHRIVRPSPLVRALALLSRLYPRTLIMVLSVFLAACGITFRWSVSPFSLCCPYCSVRLWWHTWSGLILVVRGRRITPFSSRPTHALPCGRAVPLFVTLVGVPDRARVLLLIPRSLMRFSLPPLGATYEFKRPRWRPLSPRPRSYLSFALAVILLTNLHVRFLLRYSLYCFAPLLIPDLALLPASCLVLGRPG